jgi:ABC-type lipoprotein export system ATPase subunit
MPSAVTTAIRCVDITKNFAGVKVLKGIDLEIAAGESFAIMGPSGSGKSTLLAILGLLSRPTGGSLEVLGMLAPSSERRRTAIRQTQMAWIFQRPALLRGRSALDNVALPLLLHGWSRPRAEAAAREALEAVGLGHRTLVGARNLSGGEMHRVEVARVIAQGGDLVLCDEPTASLDRENADAVMGLLVENRSPGTAVVVATHDPKVAARCDAQAFLTSGRLVEA